MEYDTYTIIYYGTYFKIEIKAKQIATLLTKLNQKSFLNNSRGRNYKKNKKKSGNSLVGLLLVLYCDSVRYIKLEI